MKGWWRAFLWSTIRKQTFELPGSWTSAPSVDGCPRLQFAFFQYFGKSEGLPEAFGPERQHNWPRDLRRISGPKASSLGYFFVPDTSRFCGLQLAWVTVVDDIIARESKICRPSGKNITNTTRPESFWVISRKRNLRTTTRSPLIFSWGKNHRYELFCLFFQEITRSRGADSRAEKNEKMPSSR